MSDVLAQLVSLLSLERLDEDRFRGQSQDIGWGQVFGGQVLGQALSAATQTIPSHLHVHSLHGYFLLIGRVDLPIDYEVDRIRDGKSFSTRRVVALQDGKAIFTMSASFQISEPGFSHQDPMPEVPGPEGLVSHVERMRALAGQLPAAFRERLTADAPIEIREPAPKNLFAPRPHPPHNAAWMRSGGQLPDDPALHAYLLAYASDFNFLIAAMFPHGVSLVTPGMQVASLDHAMWFHRPFRMDQWLLQVVDSPSASGSRALARAKFYAQDGTLVASAVQEGLIRQRTR